MLREAAIQAKKSGEKGITARSVRKVTEVSGVGRGAVLGVGC